MIEVSICIPAYENRASLQRCLDSIAIQSFSDYEIIISDDSSGDAIGELVVEYPNLPIVYHKNKTALGSPENWNNAIRLASGKYIKIMHHDDWFSTPHALQLFVDALNKHPEAAFGFSDSRDVSFDNETIVRPLPVELKYLGKNPDTLGLKNFIGSPSTTIYKNTSNMFFDTDFIWYVDMEFYIRYLRKYPVFVYIPETLINIGISETQITCQCIKDKKLRIKEEKMLHEKLKLRYNFFYFFYFFAKNIRLLRRILIIHYRFK
jgi:glycosyltransferase involved in cell wall biosynthesis